MVDRLAGVRAGLTLTDDTYLEGVADSINPSLDESGDRDIVLRAPLLIRVRGSDDISPLEAASAIVSASRIAFMTFGSADSDAQAATEMRDEVVVR